MAKLSWDSPGERFFEVGVDRGVLYPKTGPGVAWSGLIAVTESPVGGEATPFYLDGIKYENRSTAEEFAATLEAYTYPEEFAICDGTSAITTGLFANQQYRQPFGLSYRTKVGNDLKGQDFGYKIHIVYNGLATPTQRPNQTITNDPEAINFNWSITTTPVRITGMKPTAHLVIDSTLTDPVVLAAVEALLYGSEENVPTLPTPDELIAVYLGSEEPAEFLVVDNGDDTFTITGPSGMVDAIDATHYTLTAPTVTDHGDGTATATSA
jgi:hypothetical protein